MKHLRIDLDRYFPVGYNRSNELMVIWWGFFGSSLIALTIFLSRYLRSLDRCTRAFEHGQYTKVDSLPSMIVYCFIGFEILALIFVAYAAIHYRHHFRGSQSIYTMRRLPSRWELARRCLTVPLAGIAGCALGALLLWLFFVLIYVCVTPDQYFASYRSVDGSIWRAVFGG